MISDKIIVFDNAIIFFCLLLLNIQVCMAKQQLCYKYLLLQYLLRFFVVSVYIPIPPSHLPVSIFLFQQISLFYS